MTVLDDWPRVVHANQLAATGDYEAVFLYLGQVSTRFLVGPNGGTPLDFRQDDLSPRHHVRGSNP